MNRRCAILAAVLANLAFSGCSLTPSVQPRTPKQLFLQADTGLQLPEGVSESFPYEPPTNQESESIQEAGSWVTVDLTVVDPQSPHQGSALDLALSQRDPALKVKYLEKAAALGSGKAHYELAKYYSGIRPANMKLAREHVEAAASLNDPEASRVIGWMMIRGDEGYSQNLVGGVAVMEVNVSASVRTQRELGMLFCNLYSDYKLNDSAKGEAYLVQAFNAGDVPAAAALGKFYIQQGRQIDAIAPLAFAAERNDQGAAKMLSALNPQPVRAQAFVSNMPEDSGASGEIYYQRGVDLMLRKHSPSDEARAYALFDLAADKGHNLARAELSALSGVKHIMDEQQGPGWLDAAKRGLSNEAGG
ncbi:hypothetical protein SJI00_21235 [Pseudomonas sp. RP23018S]|uniref:hypothetical protein n=1 Tax=Pseudomonas sp. RP23018S TaxID=3096037 RepID=UPI002ACA089D|nr:hypothetical protein [Pseudomonas sp. RP23018S]MDZ5605302.1 hypothetical protein [Pseudomonas sp. RP23018S]